MPIASPSLRTALEVRPLTATIGAEIRGVDLAQPLEAETVRDIRETLLKWRVVFFRDQHITPEQQIRFGRYFGAVAAYNGLSPRLRELLDGLTVVHDFSPFESEAILDILFHELTKPEYHVRWHWEPNSIAFWDNRATAHIAHVDLAHVDFERLHHRITITGDVPVGPTGFRSEALAGGVFG